MNNLVKSSFGANLKLLRFFGLFPPTNHSKFYQIYAYVSLFFCAIPFPLLALIYYVQDEEINFMDAGAQPLIILSMLSFIPKMVPFITNHEEIRECVYYLQLFLKFSLNDRQKDITEDRVWICRRNFRFFFVCLTFDGSAWIFQTLFFPNRVFRMDVWLPSNLEDNKVIRFCVNLNEMIAVFYVLLITAAVDTLISGLTYHASGQVKILKDKLEFLFEYTQEKISPRCDHHQLIYRKIRECTQHHEHILSFVKKIEECFSWFLFSQLFESTVLICLCCLQLSEAKPGDAYFFVMVTYLSSALVQIYFYCYYGATLYEESNTLATAAYLGRWYEYDLKSQKALVMFMERAKIPMTVTVKKIFDLSLDTFTTALKRSYSLLAVLENY